MLLTIYFSAHIEVSTCINTFKCDFFVSLEVIRHTKGVNSKGETDILVFAKILVIWRVFVYQ